MALSKSEKLTSVYSGKNALTKAPLTDDDYRKYFDKHRATLLGKAGLLIVEGPESHSLEIIVEDANKIIHLNYDYLERGGNEFFVLSNRTEELMRTGHKKLNINPDNVVEKILEAVRIELPSMPYKLIKTSEIPPEEQKVAPTLTIIKKTPPQSSLIQRIKATMFQYTYNTTPEIEQTEALKKIESDSQGIIKDKKLFFIGRFRTSEAELAAEIEKIKKNEPPATQEAINEVIANHIKSKLSIPKTVKLEIKKSNDKIPTVKVYISPESLEAVLGKPKPQIAVLSIQTLDKQKVAFSSDEVEDYFKKNQKALLDHGEGHTGFAIAKALHAPYVVMRSKKNREQQNLKLTGHIVNNASLVITGHHSPQQPDISGVYTPNELEPLHNPALPGVSTQLEDKTQQDNFQKQIKRGPTDIVESAMSAGLPPKSHLTIMLCICNGAKNELDEHGLEKMNSSFAYRLAEEFAKNDITTTIIASNQLVDRFGARAIDEASDSLSFGKDVGMVPDSIYVFEARIGPEKQMHMQVKKAKDQTIKFDKEGMHLVHVVSSGVEHKPSVGVLPSSSSATISTKVDDESKTGYELFDDHMLPLTAPKVVKNEVEKIAAEAINRALKDPSKKWIVIKIMAVLQDPIVRHEIQESYQKAASKPSHGLTKVPLSEWTAFMFYNTEGRKPLVNAKLQETQQWLDAKYGSHAEVEVTLEEKFVTVKITCESDKLKAIIINDLKEKLGLKDQKELSDSPFKVPEALFSSSVMNAIRSELTYLNSKFGI